jgi:hypothetical protein
MPRVWLAFSIVFGFTVACGGQVQGSSDEDTGPEPQPEAPPSRDGETVLGECKLGREEDYRDPCPWVADERCYDDREMACNCACPRSRNSHCFSGFEAGAHGHVIVSCK